MRTDTKSQETYLRTKVRSIENFELKNYLKNYEKNHKKHELESKKREIYSDEEDAIEYEESYKRMGRRNLLF